MAMSSLAKSRAMVAAGWIAAGAALLGTAAPTPAQAAAFTDHECKVVYLTAKDVVSAVGKDKLSAEFRTSLVRFLMPDGKTLTCAGPTNIATPMGPDIDAYNTIRGILLEGPNPISLQNRGLVAVASLELN